jgi:hypothetical protein
MAGIGAGYGLQETNTLPQRLFQSPVGNHHLFDPPKSMGQPRKHADRDCYGDAIIQTLVEFHVISSIPQLIAIPGFRFGKDRAQEN